MSHVLTEQRFAPYEDVKKLLDEMVRSNGGNFYWHAIHKLPEMWGKCITSDGAYFE